MTNTFTVAHLIAHEGTKHPTKHIIALPTSALERPTVLITEDGKVWQYGAEYKHFPNTHFYLEVQPAYLSNKMIKTLTRAIPALERNRLL